MKLIFSIGDCNGIGLEVFYKSISNLSKINSFKTTNQISLVGNIKTITEYYNKINLPANINNDILYINNIECKLIECSLYSEIEFGKISSKAGKLAAESIELALTQVINKEYDALVTLPVSKSALYRAGWIFPGHTEMLASRCQVNDPLMILCANKIRVALATIHIPLERVASEISYELIVDKIRQFHQSIRYDFGIKTPKIAILGLNPHAGEFGSIGHSEINTIIPAIKHCVDDAIDIKGPFASDGFFAHKFYKEFDGILAMYHDQGLIPLKLLAQEAGINVTAGLPIVRTSPDHGTAFEIAGKGIANEKSTLAAIKMAIQIVKNRSK